jgi:class 3 adenylate cyclase
MVSGLPIRNGTSHAEQIALMALTLRKEVIQLMATNKTSVFKLRVGIHSGDL